MMVCHSNREPNYLHKLTQLSFISTLPPLFVTLTLKVTTTFTLSTSLSVLYTDESDHRVKSLITELSPDIAKAHQTANHPLWRVSNLCTLKELSRTVRYTQKYLTEVCACAHACV